MWIVPAGINVKALTPEAVQRHCVYQLEYLESLKRSLSREVGRELETQYLVFDFDNFSIRNLYSWQVVKAMTDMLQMMEDHFPECLEKFIAINAPSFFPILWKLIRPFMTQRTADKVEVYGKADGWREVLLNIIDAASLPAHWGGDMVGPGNDPRCRDKVNYGGRFEEGLESGESLFGEAGVERRTISRRDRWELQVGVTKAGARVNWRFQVDSGDLAFGLRLHTGEPLLPLRRVETCSRAPHEGSWFCDAPGTYVLEFDNTHSWFTSKTLAYEVNVQMPEAMKTVTDMLKTIEEHYPECLEKCMPINVPYFFPIFWQIVRPFLSQRTVDKVEVYGREGWKERLLSIVDADSLPAIWGGNMTGSDGDPRCRDKVNYGGRFEEGFDRGAHSLFGEADVHQRIIGRRDRWELPINVSKAGARISWRFQTAAGDLAFGLRMNGGKHLVPLQRIEASSYIPQRGSWQCDSPGTYVLEFDNTHSWLNGKTLAYMVDLSAPEDGS
ncbi:hypothetical protein HPB50_014950 [Hyalomma asiaticum]|uniref:Uncharacterized protein n=1 Tax=Hyalomma asiaticum TaxID=266040 RepID=A0ACB7S0V9_HYAAI|nr:hypothetical protein HPB50_014950 [Hyalomma asiaticum]